MPEQTLADQDRQVVQILAFAGREFDRVRDLLIRDDEPGVDQVREAAPDEEKTDDKEGGALARVLDTVGAAAQSAGRVVTGSVHPRHDDWDTLGLDQRIDWWVARFGTAAAAIASVPNLGGRLGQAVGVGSLVAVAAQVLIVNAVAHEMGVSDLDKRVSVAADIVFGREISPEAVHVALDDPEAQPEEEPAGEGPEEKTGVLAFAGRTAALIWRVARRLWSFRSGLEERQQGGFISRAISNLPVVGAVGAFFNEKKGISRAADKAREAFAG